MAQRTRAATVTWLQNSFHYSVQQPWLHSDSSSSCALQGVYVSGTARDPGGSMAAVMVQCVVGWTWTHAYENGFPSRSACTAAR
jgi:hypothetical protein